MEHGTPTRGVHERTLTLTLRVDEDGRPTGTLRCADAQPVAFVGWLPLIAELSNMLDANS